MSVMKSICRLNSLSVRYKPISHGNILLQKRYNWYQRDVGIELEMIVPDIKRRKLKQHLSHQLSKNGITFSRWKIKSDNSIDCSDFGNEIISPKMKLNHTSERLIILLCKELNELDANTNISTGFHVHCDGSCLTLEQSAHIAFNYSFFESVIDKFVHPSRRKNINRYCQTLPNINPKSRLYKEWIDEFEENYASYNDEVLWNPDEKYHKLNFNNLRSWVDLNTIENRHHHGSIDAEEILNWIKFNLLMVQQSINKGIFSGLTFTASDEIKDALLWQFINNEELRQYYSQKNFQDENDVDWYLWSTTH